MIKQVVLIGFGFLFLLANAQAAKPSVDGEFVAARLTQILSRSHSFRELANSLPSGGKDQAAIDAAYKKLGPFAPMIVSQPKAALVLILEADRPTLVDFTELDKFRVSVNGRVIHLTAEKNFLNYRSEIAEILKQRSKSAWLWNFNLPLASAAETKAWGDDLPVWLGDFLDKTRGGSAAGVVLMGDPLVSRRLATDIIAAYKIDETYFESPGNHYGPDGHDPFSPLVFRCEHGSLQQLGYMSIDAQKRPMIRDGLLRTGPHSFRFTTDKHPPDAELDNDFKVMKTGGHLREGQNLLTAPNTHFGRFPGDCAEVLRHERML